MNIPFIGVLLDGAHSLILSLATLLEPVAGGAAAAAAIVLVTLIVRAALIPLGVRLIRAEINRKRMAPKVAELQRRFKKNPELLQRKTLELHKEEGVSPFAGILPSLAQIPVVSLLYGVAVSATINGHPNELLTQQLFGAPLGHSFVTALTSGDFVAALVPAVLLVVIGVVAWFTRQQALRMATPVDPASPLAGLTGMLSWLPFISVVISAFVPLAAVLYVSVSTTWTFFERTILRRQLPGGALNPATA
ncbi:MAG: YidC/Oxa1 family membrane protein insertase [Pseudolysinimonas sp.]|uniref:YidC/Oxa1 family membrane protein insertase n=1 Tax=Pseudolysinimonas sp. TaxID=2680009 RepID=UPI00326741B4